MDIKSSLSFTQKELRKTEKKIRRMKGKKTLDMKKISELESQSKVLRGKIRLEERQKEKKEEPIVNNSIPNTPEMRKLRKKTIQKVNEHLMSQHMDNQMKVRMDIIRHLKEELKEENKDEKIEEFFRLRKEISDKFTS